MSSHQRRARELTRQREYRRRQRQETKATQRRRRWAVIASAVVVALAAVLAYGALSRTPQDAAGPKSESSAAASSVAVLHTSVGDITIALASDLAPRAVDNFVELATKGFYDATTCHRLVTSTAAQLLQCGSPTGEGTGGPGYSFGPIENAPADGRYPPGTVAMARVPNDSDSMGSQFFLVSGDTTLPEDSAGGYTVFGTITSGLDALQAVADAGTADGQSDGPPATPVTIQGVETQ